MRAPEPAAWPRLARRRSGVRVQGVGPGTSLGGRYALRTRLSHRSDLEHWSAHDTTLERDVAVTVFDSSHPHAAAVLDAARRAAGVEDPRLRRILDRRGVPGRCRVAGHAAPAGAAAGRGSPPDRR